MYNRRELLQSSTLMSTVLVGDKVLTRPNYRGERKIAEEQPVLSGSINLLTNDKPTGAEIAVFDIRPEELTPTLLGNDTAIDSTGDFSVELDPTDRMLIVAKRTDANGDLWFTVREILPEDLSTEHELVLNRHQLVTPTLAGFSDDGWEWTGNGAVTLWRWIDPDDPRNQSLRIEVLGIADGEILSQQNGGQNIRDIESWELKVTDAAPRPNSTRGYEYLGPVSATFGLTLPEHVYVGYGTREGETVAGRTVNVFETKPQHPTHNLRDRHIVTRRHILQSPSIPAFSHGRDPINQPDVSFFRGLSEGEAEERREEQEKQDKATELMLNLFAEGTPVSWVTLILDVLSFFEEKDVDAIVGDEFADPQADARWPSKNNYDTITGAWTGSSPAIVFEVPFRFVPEKMDSETEEFIATAQWTTKADKAGTQQTSRFGKKFEIGPLLEIDESNDKRRSFVAEQGANRFEVTPLQTGETVEEFYGYEPYHSHTPTGIERSNVSNLFLFDGPNGISLVVLHDAPNDEHGTDTGGGRVVLNVTGLPADGNWVVKDGPNDNYNPPVLEWEWNPEHTDGGAFRGGLDGEFEITIDPTFERGIDGWHLLSGDADNPKRITLDKTTPVTIRSKKISQSGYRGRYYNHTPSHPDFGHQNEAQEKGLVKQELPLRLTTAGQEVIDQFDWYDEEYLSKIRIDESINYSAGNLDDGQKFPLNEGLPNDPLYAAVHWKATTEVPRTDTYEFRTTSDDDSWVFVDGKLVVDNGGKHPNREATGRIDLSDGEHQLDIFFAEREAPGLRISFDPPDDVNIL